LIRGLHGNTALRYPFFMHGAHARSMSGGGVAAALTATWAVILAAGILQTANGVQTDLLGVRAGLAAFPTWSIGVMMAGYYVGFSMGPILSPRIIRHLGHTRAMAMGVAIAAAVIVLHGSFVNWITWTLLRAFCGFFLSMSYVACESFINDRAESHARGRVFSIYMVMQMAGMTVAQGLFLVADPATLTPFMLCAGVFLLSAAPLKFVIPGRDAPPPEPFSLVRLFRLSPLGFVATILAGTSWSVLFTFGPVYAQRKGFDLAGISLFMSLAMASGAVLQFPLGWLSDRIGRWPTIVILSGIATASALFGAWANGHASIFIDGAAVLTGGFVFPLYGLSAAHTNDTVQPASRVAASAGLILLFGLGSIVGPLAAGGALALFGPIGFFALLSAVMFACLATAMATR
jgi:MFS family permease